MKTKILILLIVLFTFCTTTKRKDDKEQLGILFPNSEIKYLTDTEWFGDGPTYLISDTINKRFLLTKYYYGRLHILQLPIKCE